MEDKNKDILTTWVNWDLEDKESSIRAMFGARDRWLANHIYRMFGEDGYQAMKSLYYRLRE